MGTNPAVLEETGLAPILASGAITACRAVIATTPDSSKRQRGKMCDAVGQNADLSLVPRFLGVSPDAIADATMGSIQRRGRCRAEGGGVITAPALVTLDSDGQFVAYTHDATKFGMVVGYAASDCGGAAQYFDLVIAPMIIGPASADTVDFTLTGTLQAEQVTSTDDGAIAGLLTVGEYIEQTEIVDPAAPAANKARLYAKDNGAGKTQLVVRFPTGAVQVIATEP